LKNVTFILSPFRKSDYHRLAEYATKIGVSGDFTMNMIDRVALALYEFETRAAREQFPDCSATDADGWSVLLNERGKEFWRQKARVAIDATGCSLHDIERLASGDCSLCDGYDCQSRD
jgi:hypothetical protein